MPNGRPHDLPRADILNHELTVYGLKSDPLI
jgi:hypothetical protein